MNKYIKGAAIFTGGMISGFMLCGSLVTRVVVKTDSIRESLKRALPDRIEHWLFGETGRSTRPTYVNYKCYGRTTDIRFESRTDAENALEGLQENIKSYGVATISDLYEIAGVNHNSYVNEYQGWYNLENAKIVRVRDGYILELPKPLPIQ